MGNRHGDDVGLIEAIVDAERKSIEQNAAGTTVRHWVAIRRLAYSSDRNGDLLQDASGG
jgi:hypothetical protein